MSNAIVFLPIMIVVFLFRNSRRRNLRVSRIETAIKEQRETTYPKFGISTQSWGSRGLRRQQMQPSPMFACITGRKQISDGNADAVASKFHNPADIITDASPLAPQNRVSKKKVFTLPW